MTVNIISDIHANYNQKTKKVIYNLPFKFAQYKYKDAINSLYDFWFSDPKHKEIEVRYGRMAKAFDVMELKTADDIEKFITTFRSYSKNRFFGVDSNLCMEMARKLTNLDDTFEHYSFRWNSKNKIKILDLKDYMFKCLYDFNPEKLQPADYLIIAGDLGLDNIYDKILADLEEKTKGKFKKILHIAGNHDHWWIGYPRCNEKKPDNVNLTHDYCEHVDGEYAFIGCTLWTPISDRNIWNISRHMNDYRYTPNFSPYTSREQYRIQSEWLKNKLEEYKDKKVVVFTHHQPFEELTAEDYKHNGRSWDGCDVNAAYVVLDHSLDDINKLGNIKLWCCGHTHQNYDGILHDVHVVRNPIGYRDDYGYLPAENTSDTWYNKVIEV